MRKTLLTGLLALTLLPAFAAADVAYIGDTLYVPLRAGQGNNYKIINKGLKTGTQVQVLDWPDGADWAQVQVGDVTGWIPTQYLQKEPVAAQQLAVLQKKYQDVTSQLSDLKTRLASTEKERDQLKSQVAGLQDELGQNKKSLSHLQDVASDPIRLDQANQKLNKELSLLHTKLDQVQAENSMLSSDKTYRGWVYGLVTIFAGMIIGWLFKSRSSKARSGWA